MSSKHVSENTKACVCIHIYIHNVYICMYVYIHKHNGVVQWLVDASSVAASGCHRWLALLGERVSKMCKSHLAST